jgi:acetoin utilization protein AcuB
MFNMYDDEGVKLPIINPYEVKRLEKSSAVQNRVSRDDKGEEKGNKQSFESHLNDEAKQAYKKMIDIHVDEEILHTYQLMHSDIISIQESHSLKECWDIMRENELKQVVVLSLDGKLQGIATMKKLVQKLVENLGNRDYLEAGFVSSITEKNIITAEPISDIRRVAKVMVKYHLNLIPIVDPKNDEVVGVVTRADILKAVASNSHIQMWA